MRINLMILSVTCVFVALWYYLCLSDKGRGFEYSNPFFFEKNVSLNSAKTFRENSNDFMQNYRSVCGTSKNAERWT